METRAIFLDLSKAFDRVWHKGLIYKLQCNGISGSLLMLLEDFLHNRKQRVILNGQASEWQMVSSGVPQGSVLGPLLFLIYINDIVDNINCDVRLFADDKSLFSIVNDATQTALKISEDLDKIKKWALQWKMEFNADKTEEVIFSAKKQQPFHPSIEPGNQIITRKNEHKHLGVILDSKLNFQSQVREAVIKARRGISLIKYLSKYFSRDVLDEVYKLYVRPHLDYGDIIYHKFDPDMRSTVTKSIEQAQYTAALANTGAWKGTSRQKIYEELGWESMYDRRWYRRLCHFVQLRQSKTPEYLFNEIPPERQIPYMIRNLRNYDPNFCRTNRFSNSYFRNTIYEFNLLNSEIRNSKSISEFKRKLLSVIRPTKNQSL